MMRKINGKFKVDHGFYCGLATDGMYYTIPVNNFRPVIGGRAYYGWGAINADGIHPSWVEGLDKEMTFVLE